MLRENMKLLYYNCIILDIFNLLMYLLNNINYNLIKVNFYKLLM